LTEDIVSGDRVHCDVDVDIVGEVVGKDLGCGYPGSLCRCCVRAEIRVEVGGKCGGNDLIVLLSGAI
jgi:hypothetical protein